MQVLEIRPARVKAALVEIGDMLVSSPVGENGARPPRWIGAVTHHVIVEAIEGTAVTDPASWRQWRIALVSGDTKETTPVPADGWVWVHLPSAELAPPRTRSLAEIMAEAAGETTP